MRQSVVPAAVRFCGFAFVASALNPAYTPPDLAVLTATPTVATGVAAGVGVGEAVGVGAGFVGEATGDPVGVGVGVGARNEIVTAPSPAFAPSVMFTRVADKSK